MLQVLSGLLLFSMLASADPIMWVAYSGGLATVDIGTGVIITDTNSASPAESIAFAPNGTLYGSSLEGLYTINTATGSATLVGDYSTEITNIAFGPDGTLYGLTSQAPDGTTDLVTINPATAAISVVGSNGEDAPLYTGGLAFVDGWLYAFGVSDGLYSIDPATGAATLVGLGANNLDAFRGLASPDGSSLCGVVTAPGPQGSGYNLYTVNTSTAADSFVFNFGDPYIDLGGVNDITFGPESGSPTPEPSSGLLTAIGLAGALVMGLVFRNSLQNGKLAG